MNFVCNNIKIWLCKTLHWQNTTTKCHKLNRKKNLKTSAEKLGSEQECQKSGNRIHIGMHFNVIDAPKTTSTLHVNVHRPIAKTTK